MDVKKTLRPRTAEHQRGENGMSLRKHVEFCAADLGQKLVNGCLMAVQRLPPLPATFIVRSNNKLRFNLRLSCHPLSKKLKARERHSQDQGEEKLRVSGTKALDQAAASNETLRSVFSVYQGQAYECSFAWRWNHEKDLKGRQTDTNDEPRKTRRRLARERKRRFSSSSEYGSRKKIVGEWLVNFK
jgi:hypothetical protein